MENAKGQMPTFPPKNEETNSILLLWDLFSLVFWRKLKTPKRDFEIIWPLAETKQKNHDIFEWTKILFSTVYKPRQTENYEFKMKSDVYGLKSRT